MDLLVLRKMAKINLHSFSKNCLAVGGINGRSVGITSMFIQWEVSRQEFSFNRSLRLFFVT
ncbi:hypothetical protein T4B_11832 [Trichinella pseudospiralis]|uniref:Uncharacterized protein n=2 Tax=Trichinella pseudospiralis TaxID=6337 RepID=A0A0V1GLC9_TRIPS|nr:hypothetical protein T4B_11832 [Trichinella pseudospiralis]KRZ05686.1 hypothetical protein T4C_12471 [Trichinella pseudospiralis]KRZ12423.1 hypothetical protein T4C_1844 [Trichinella pseudospiralis]